MHPREGVCRPRDLPFIDLADPGVVSTGDGFGKRVDGVGQLSQEAPVVVVQRCRELCCFDAQISRQRSKSRRGVGPQLRIVGKLRQDLPERRHRATDVRRMIGLDR